MNVADSAAMQELLKFGRLLQLSPEYVLRLAHGLLELPRRETRHIEPIDAMVVSVAAYLRCVGFDEAQATMILKEAISFLRQEAAKIAEAWEQGADNTKLPTSSIVIVDQMLVTWDGLNKFYRPAYGAYEHALPEPGVIHTAICLAPLWIRGWTKFQEAAKNPYQTVAIEGEVHV